MSIVNCQLFVNCQLTSGVDFLYTEIDGINVNYIDVGDGDVVLLLHGWGCDGSVYRGIVDCLSPFFRVVVPDLPGFGESDEPREPFGVFEYADFVLKFATKLNIERCILFGHSLGGRIIIKMFAQFDFNLHIPKIILAGSAGVKPKATLKGKLRARLFKIARAAVLLPPVKAVVPNALERLSNKFGSADYKAASPVMRQSLVKIVNEDLTPQMSAVKPSTLLIWGEDDDSTPLSDGQLMEKLFPNAGLALIKNAGHYSFLEQPATFYRILSSFLGI